MSGESIAQIITSIAALVAAFGSVIAAIVSARNARKIEEVHKATNSLTDRLVETTKTEAHAAGREEYRQETSSFNDQSSSGSNNAQKKSGPV